MVVRVVTRGWVVTVFAPAIGSGPGSAIGIERRGGPVVRMGALSGGGRIEAGRKFGSGSTTIWEGMLPCVTIVGEGSDDGKETKVCRPLVVGRSRRKCAGGKGSSYSIDGSKKGKSPAK